MKISIETLLEGKVSLELITEDEKEGFTCYGWHQLGLRYETVQGRNREHGSPNENLQGIRLQHRRYYGPYSGGGNK